MTKQVASIRKNVSVPIVLDRRRYEARLVSFHGLCDGREHIAVSFHDGPHGCPLVRLHSECLTGDVLGSARCDCGPQLHEAIEQLADARGILLYLRQEGRGIGLYNKLDAYELQDLGIDTFTANERLGFAADQRDYRPAAQMLQALGVNEIRLLTNNPDKLLQLEAYGITVREQISTGTHVHDYNRRYLQTKVERAGHLIRLSENPA